MQKQKSKATTKTIRDYVDFNSPTYLNFRKALSRQLIIAGVDVDALKGKSDWFTSNNVEQMLAVKKKFPKIYAVILEGVVKKDLTMRIGAKGHVTLEN